MPDQQKTCTTCRKSFYTKNSFNSICPDCHRVASANQQTFDNQKILQDNQHNHERKLKQEELNQQKIINEENRRFEKEQFKKKQLLEEYKLHKNRQLQKEYLTQTEVTSIKDKVYQLALCSTADTENITKLTKLLIQQHQNHTEYIYRNIIAIGSPFDEIVKAITCNQLREKISNTYPDNNLSFQQKTCKYFMPIFSGYEYDILKESIEGDNDFVLAVSDEINLLNTESAQRKKEIFDEIEQLNQSANSFNYAIHNDTLNYESRSKRISFIKTLFGEQNTFFPRLNWFFAALYFVYLYYFKTKFALYPFLTLLGIGYFISYIIIVNNNKTEEYNFEVSRIIRNNECQLKDITINLERKKNELQKQSEIDTNIIEVLNDYLQRLQAKLEL